MTHERIQIGTVLTTLSRDKTVFRLSDDGNDRWTLILHPLLMRFGITQRTREQIVYLLRNGESTHDEKVSEITSLINNNHLALFLRLLRHFHEYVFLPEIVYSILFQEPSECQTLWLPYLLEEQDVDISELTASDHALMLLTQLHTIQGNRNPVMAASSSRYIFEIRNNRITDGNRPWLIEWDVNNKYNSVPNTFLKLRHLWDNYDIPHYHVAGTYDEVVTMMLINLKRTWLAAAEENERRLSNKSRVNYALYPCSLNGLTQEQRFLISSIMYAHIILINKRKDDVDKLTLPEIKRIVEELSPTYMIGRLLTDVQPITNEQLFIMRRLGFEPIGSRCFVTSPIIINFGLNDAVTSRTISDIPMGNEFSTALIWQNISWPPVNSPRARKFLFITPVVPIFSQELVQINLLTVASYDRNPEESRDMTKRALTVRGISDMHLNQDLVVNEQDPLIRNMIINALSLQPSPLRITINPATQAPIIESLNGVIAKRPDNYEVFDLPLSTLLGSIMVRFDGFLARTTRNYSATLINMPELPTLRRTLRDTIAIRQVATDPKYFGDLYGTVDASNFDSDITTIINVPSNPDGTVHGLTLALNIMTSQTSNRTAGMIVPNKIFFTVLDMLAAAFANLQIAAAVQVYPINMVNITSPSVLILIQNEYGGTIIPPGWLPIATLLNRQLIVSSLPLPESIMVRDDLIKLRPTRDTGGEIMMPPGVAMTVTRPFGEARQAVGFMLSFCDHVTITKRGTSVNETAVVTGITSRNRIALYNALKSCREYDGELLSNQFILDETIPTPWRANELSPEELITRADHEAILSYRKYDAVGSIDNDLIDIGSGKLLNFHLTNGKYICYDSIDFNLRPIPRVEFHAVTISLHDPLPSAPGTDILIYNSIYFIDSWTPYRQGQNLTLTAWATDHFADAVDNESNMYLNFPMMTEEIHNSIQHFADVLYNATTLKYMLKLGTYKHSECLTPADIQDIIDAIEALGGIVVRIQLSYEDYSAVGILSSRTVSLENLNNAVMLRNAIVTLCVKYR